MALFRLTLFALFLIFLTPIVWGGCLEKNNGGGSLRHMEVYTNGKLKFRLDGWDDNSISIKSNAPSFNGKFSAHTDKFDQQEIVLQDSKLCPGSEITVRCGRVNNPYFICQFSEF
ncbi:MAG: hypothetical protein IPL99_01310 [Candidatus Competibacteraceae bacterium]|nr:hypothetical protein [Candidatus Competibacteraceae bacterium]